MLHSTLIGETVVLDMLSLDIACPVCDARVTVRENIVERHFVPDTKFPCPYSFTAWDRWRSYGKTS
jgi:hypothetical protein